MSVPVPQHPPDPAVPAAGAPDAVVDEDLFRRTVGHFASGVTVVTTRVGQLDHAMTASAFTSVSL
ncbi:MAG: hypothetical protein QOJ89_5193, partial [bacterium]